MKLIIDIPEDMFEWFKNGEIIDEYDKSALKQVFKNGIPLDDVKADIKKECDIEAQNHDTFDDYSDGRYDAFNACLKIIDKHIGKAESEE